MTLRGELHAHAQQIAPLLGESFYAQPAEGLSPVGEITDGTVVIRMACTGSCWSLTMPLPAGTLPEIATPTLVRNTRQFWDAARVAHAIRQDLFPSYTRAMEDAARRNGEEVAAESRAKELFAELTASAPPQSTMDDWLWVCPRAWDGASVARLRLEVNDGGTVDLQLDRLSGDEALAVVRALCPLPGWRRPQDAAAPAAAP